MENVKPPTTLISIDPGISGGYAVFKNGVLVETKPLPVRKLGNDMVVDCKKLKQMLPNYASEVVLEKVHAMAGQGLSSTFKFGRNTGQVLAVLQQISKDGKVREAPPAVWKMALGLTGKRKEAAIEEAKIIANDPNVFRTRNKKQALGMADAICIGYFWLRHAIPA